MKKFNYFNRIGVAQMAELAITLPFQMLPVADGDTQPKNIEVSDIRCLCVRFAGVGETGIGKPIGTSGATRYELSGSAITVHVAPIAEKGEAAIIIDGKYGQVNLHAKIVLNVGAITETTTTVSPYVFMAIATDTDTYELRVKVDELGQKVIGDFYLQNAAEFAAYNSSIEEIYFYPYYLNNVTIIDFRNYNGTIYCKTNLWSFSKDITTNTNGDIIPLVVTKAGGNAEVSDVVGYVVFKDIETFKTTNFGSANRNQLNLLFVGRLQNAPTIAAHLQLQKEKIINWYIPNESTPEIAIYESCISELFLKLYHSIDLVSVKNYSEKMFVDFKTSSGTIIVSTSDSLNKYSNGEIIPITVSKDAGNFLAGDILGYIIFKDIDTFKTTNYGGFASVNLNNANNIVNSPIILTSFLSTDENNKSIYIPNESTPEIAIYESCISELWINPKYGSLDYLFKAYDGYSHLNYLETGKSYLCKTDLSKYSNGDIIPLVVTKAGGNASIGDVVGYVIFKDIDTFKSTNYAGSMAFVNKERAFSLLNNKTIWNETIVNPDTVEQIVDSRISFNLTPQLPDVIYAVVGTQVYLWNDTISYSIDRGLNSPMNYSVYWHSYNIGVITERGFKFTPEDSHAGNSYAVRCDIYSVTGVLVSQKQFTIKVLAKNALTSAKKIVFFGDSTGAQTATNMYNDFHNSEKFTGVAPTMLGSRGDSIIRYEAVGGYSWGDYATQGRAAFRCFVTNAPAIPLNSKYTNNGFTWEVIEVNVTNGVGNILITKDSTTYNETPSESGVLVAVSSGVSNIPYDSYENAPANPLWDSNINSLSIAHYKDVVGISQTDNFDAVSFLLGLNSNQTPEQTTAYIKSLYNLFVEDNPNCLFLLALVTSCGNTQDGFGKNYGASINSMTNMKKTFALRELYLKLQDDQDLPNLRIVPAHTELDRYYGYEFSSRQISQRYTENEQYHNNAVHPASSGYWQLGDCFFAAFIGALTE